MRTKILLTIILCLVINTYAQNTGRFKVVLRSVRGTVLTQRDVDLYQSAVKQYDLAESTSRPGEYSHDTVAYGVYDIYLDGTIYESAVGFSDVQKTINIVDKFTVTGDSLTVTGKITAGEFSGDSLTVTGKITAAEFSGNGSGLTGIGSGTGGINNTGSTTIGADTDENGIGIVDLQTRNTSRFQVLNDGKIAIGRGSASTLLHTGIGSDPTGLSSGTVHVIQNSSLPGDNAGIDIVSGSSGSGFIYFGDESSPSEARITYDQTSMILANDYTELSIKSDGKIGILNDTPASELDVDGTVSADSFRVKMQPAATDPKEIVDELTERAVNSKNYDDLPTALTAAKDSGRVLFVPSGTHSLNSQMLIDQPMTVQGGVRTGNKDAFIDNTGSILKAYINDGQTAAIFDSSARTTIRGVTLFADTTSNTGPGIVVARPQKPTTTIGAVLMDGLLVTNFDSSGIEYIGPDNGSLLQNSWVGRNHGIGLKVTQTSGLKGLQFFAKQNRIVGNDSGNVLINGINNWQLSGNGFLGARNEKPNVYVYGGSSRISYGEISNNDIENDPDGDASRATALKIENVKGLHVFQNRISGTWGIETRTSVFDVILAGNYFAGCDTNAIVTNGVFTGILLGENNGLNGKDIIEMGGDARYVQLTALRDSAGVGILDASEGLNLQYWAENDVNFFSKSGAGENRDINIYGDVSGSPTLGGTFTTNASGYLAIDGANRLNLTSSIGSEIRALTEFKATTKMVVGGTGSAGTEALKVVGEIKVSVTTSNVSNPPTDAELDALFTSPGTQGDGWSTYIKDSDSNNLYHVMAISTSWYVGAAMTPAL